MALPTSQHNVTVRKLSSTLNSYNTKVNTKLNAKADKVSGATNGNFAGLDANGNLTDSGKKASNFATSAQGTKADSAIQGVKVNGTALTPDSTNVVNITNTSLGLNNVTNDAQVKRSEMGVANGVATLDTNGKIPATQIPGSYDDVKEGYLGSDGEFYEDAQHITEIPAASDKVYVDIPTNKTYRWSGTQYVVIGSDLALGETSSTAYRGDRGKAAYDHSQLTSGNPHNVTKSDVGLGSVVNTGDSATPVIGGTTKFTTGGAYTELAKKADKSSSVTNVAWDSTNKKLTKTINGTTSDVVAASTIKTAMGLTKSDVGLGNVDNKSEATIKSDFTGAVADGNTGFPTGDAVFDAIAAVGKGETLVTSSNTFADVQAIYTAGRLPVYTFTVEGTTFRLPLSGVYSSNSSFTFSGVCGNAGKKLFQISISSSGWGTLSEKNIETEDDLVTSWSSTTSDSKYPSEKLVKTSLDNKVDKVSGKGLSTNDYTNAEKNKLAGISTGANKVEVDSDAGNGNIKIDGTVTTVYTHPTTAGNKHIPSGGSSGQFLGYDSSGTAKWVANPNTDTKVTSVGNHYAPSEDAQAEKDASGGSATQLPTSSTGTLVQVVTGVKMDAKGHVTGVVSKGLWSPDNNTTYTNVKLGSGTASATLGTSPAFTASLSKYTLDGGNGGFIAIKFSNDVPASATLNVNNTGAKAIYYKGAPITAGVIQSGDTAFMMYNGVNGAQPAQYVLLGTDRSVEEMTDTEVTDLVNALT